MFVLIIFAIFFGTLFWYFGGDQIKDEFPYYLKRLTRETATVKVGTKTLTAEVVKTPSALAQGLSGRETLPQGRGMLFVFSKPGVYSITMRGMRFPLDIIWVRDGKIVHLQNNAPAPDQNEEPAVFTPSAESTHVIEAAQDFIESSGAAIGVEVTIEYKKN